MLKRKRFDMYAKNKENNSLESELRIIDSARKITNTNTAISSSSMKGGPLSEREVKNFNRTQSIGNLQLKELQQNGQNEF